MEWEACIDEYSKLVKKMNTPRVVIDGAACTTATLVKVDSASRGHGMLLDAIQALTDLGLAIKKAYISSDGPWFMDVFHVVDRRGRKLSDPALLSLLELSLAEAAATSTDNCTSVDDALVGLTALELTGDDRPGLLSEVFAVLRDLECSVVAAKAWTHNARTAALIFVKDHNSGCPIDDVHRVRGIEARLLNVLRGDHGVRGARTAVSPPSVTHLDRRLHQMMFADRDYERIATRAGETDSSNGTPVSIQNWRERGYSVVSVQCRDRPKLLFDVVCTLTDMDYVVFHGTIDTVDTDRAYQEFYIRHFDGSPISSEAERQRVIQCLQAAIERRAYEGLRLELCTTDRRGLLADVTRTFRENGLSVTRAEVTTKAGMAVNEFYVTDTAGHLPDRRTINAVIEAIGSDSLRLGEERLPWRCDSKSRPTAVARREDAEADRGVGAGLFFLGNLVMRNLYYLGLIRSCS